MKRFHRESFNIDELFSAAANLKHTPLAIRQRLDALLKDPSDEFLRLLVRTYTGCPRKRPWVSSNHRKESDHPIYNDTINERLSSATQKTRLSLRQARVAGAAEIGPGRGSGVINRKRTRSISDHSHFRREFSPHRITYKDTKSYFSILLDDSTWRWICRLDLEGNRWHIILHAGDGKERRPLNSLDELFSMEAELLEAARRQDRSRMTGAEAQ